jgi:DNA-binding IclR family transcriptional regulator
MSELSSPGPNYHVPALEKALDILECLARQGTPLTQTQLARALGKGSNELFRMLVSLERRGYIQRDEVSGAYTLTLRLYELSHTHSPFDGLLRAAARPMRQLVETVRESCHLSVLHDGKLLVLHQEVSPEKVRLSIEVGSTFPLLQTVSGRVLLAHRPPALIEDLLRLDADYAAYTPGERSALETRLKTIRTRGYEEAYSETREGVRDLAVLVGSPANGTQAALAIAALTRRRESRTAEYLPALQECSVAIARAAGLLV